MKNYLDIFKGKKVAVVVPHQDDEINIAGALLCDIPKFSDTYIVYTTNGDYNGLGEIRLHEALRVGKLLGINESNIFFLGYGDEMEENRHILFEYPETSHNGKKYTYGLKEHPEFSYSFFGVHHVLNRKNFSNDLQAVLEKINPDCLISIGPDNHPDHYGLYQEIQQVIPKLKKPIEMVLWGLAYSSAFYSIDDYSAYDLGATKYNRDTEQTKIVQDEDKFCWDLRLRLPVGLKTRTKLIYNNLIFKAMKLYKSQTGCLFATKIANSDLVLWNMNNDPADIWFIKICINNNYVYHYYTNDKIVYFDIIGFDLNGNLISINPNDCVIKINNELCNEYQINLDNYKKSIHLSVSFKSTFDSITIQKKTSLHYNFEQFMNWINKGFVKCYSYYSRVCFKIKTLIRIP